MYVSISALSCSGSEPNVASASAIRFLFGLETLFELYVPDKNIKGSLRNCFTSSFVASLYSSSMPWKMLEIVARLLNINVSAALKYIASGKVFITNLALLFSIMATSPNVRVFLRRNREGVIF